jgi:trimeric autotransporter adhesin
MTSIRSGRPSARFSAVLALCLGFLSSPLAIAQDQQLAPTAARITQSIRESSLVTLRGNTPPMAQAKFDVGAAPEANAANRLILVLTRSAAQEAALQTWLDSVQDANSPNYQHWLSAEEFGKRFGVADSDLAAVKAWLQAHGFTVNKVSPGKMSIEFSGTTAQLETAFHTSIHAFVIDGVQHWSNVSDPQIPAALAPVVAGVAKLNDFNPRSHAVRVPGGAYNAATKRLRPAYTVGTSTNGYTIFLGPADAATIYDTPTTLNANHSGTLYDGTGATIGIAGDSNIDITQNAKYRATFGLPAKATTVVVDGADPGENGDAIEAYLDTQVAGGIAPNANVILYTAANTYLSAGLFLAIQRAVDDNQVDILNISFGGCEAEQGASGNQYINNLWQQAAAQGISLTVSSGDSGSAGCDNPNTEYQASLGLAVNALASTPYNIAVGGTDFDDLYANFPSSFTQYVDLTNTLANHRSALKYIPERPWNDSTFQGDNGPLSANLPWTATAYSYNANIVAGGGGFSGCVQQSGGACSAGYPVPAWQSTFATTSSGRNLPDVSLLAGNGLYGAAWGLCTDLDANSSGSPVTDCAGNPTTGNNFYLTGVGGTSAAAPAFAGMLALLKQKTGTRLGQADYVLYKLAKSHYSAVFHDIQTGNNSVACSASPSGCAATNAGYYFMTGYNTASGFDEASGLGSVDATQMLNNWAGASLISTTSSLTLNGSTAPLSITHGASVAVSAGVSGSNGPPDGNIALVDTINPATVPNSGSIGSFPLASGTATGTTNSLPGGSYNVSAHYGGSATFASSDSNSIPVTVSAESSSTNLSVKSYFDPQTGQQASTPYYGFIYLLDAQPYGNSASAANPDGAATGTITFKSGTASVGTASLASNGIAELQTSTIPAGSDSLTAVFPGDASFAASTSAPVALNVQPLPTWVSLNSDASGNLNLGSSVTLTAKIVSSTNFATLDSVGAAPTGTITLTDSANNTTLATLPVVGAAGSPSAFATAGVTYTTTSLGAGQHAISATYSGDTNYAPSTQSYTIYVFVNGLASTMTLNPAPSPVKTNQALQVTVNVAPSGSGNPAPTGTVSLIAYENSNQVFTITAAALSNGSAVITVPANTFSIGTVAFYSNYTGDKTYNSNSVNTFNFQVISAGTVTPTVTMALPSGVQNFPIAIPVTVTGPSGDPTPTGSVTLTVGPSTFTQTLSNGVTTFTYQAGLQAGPDAVTAVFTGDNTYTAGTATGTLDVIAPSYLNITPAIATIAVNQAEMVTVAVQSFPNIPAPTGTVTLTSGSFVSPPSALSNGSVTITIPANSLSEGFDVLAVAYSGDANYQAASGNGGITVSAPMPPGLTLSGTNITVAAGATASNTSTVTVAPTFGFTGAVSLTATVSTFPQNANARPTLSFGTTSPVTITGAGSQTATLTITTTAPTAASTVMPPAPGAQWRHGALALACLLMLGVGAIRRRGRAAFLMLILLVTLAGGAVSCGGGGGSGNTGAGGAGGNTKPGTTPGLYTITVTGTSGAASATTTINLTVN